MQAELDGVTKQYINDIHCDTRRVEQARLDKAKPA